MDSQVHGGIFHNFFFLDVLWLSRPYMAIYTHNNKIRCFYIGIVNIKMTKANNFKGFSCFLKCEKRESYLV